MEKLLHTLFTLWLCGDSLSNPTLTQTTGWRDLVPQTKKINGSAESSTSLHLDLSKFAEHEMGRRQSEIWSWDYWCQAQPSPGNCTNTLIRYYYDSQLDQCRIFTYSGCGGNQNNFEISLTCERFCKGTSYMKIKEFDDKKRVCELQPSSGLCMAFITKYYYEVKSNSCKEFTYGGCGGNQNRFNTPKECLNTCKRPVTIITPESVESDSYHEDA